MGLLDGILGSVGSALGGQTDSSPLLHAAIDMLSASGHEGSGGGLASLIDQFRQSGLGREADSWIGTGRNLPISAGQLSQALGADKLGEIATRLGLPHGEVADGLSRMLPDLIDRVTPGGQLPASMDAVQDLLGALLRR